MIDLKQQQETIDEIRKTRLKLAKQISSEKTKLRSLNQRISDNIRYNRDPQYQAEQTRSKSSIDEAQKDYDKLEENLNDKIKEMNQHSPKELIEQLDDSYPFLLLPVKIETKFKTVNDKKELWIRIFPDDIAIHTHEELLTDTEYENGKIYWKNIFNETDNSIKEGAWNTLVSAYGANRSAWVIKETKPANWDENADDENELIFPVYTEFKTGSWTEAPHIRIMPDCFVVTGYSGGKVIFEETGSNIPDNLQVSLDPASEEDQLKRDETSGEIIVNEKISWIFDFKKAEAAGMALRISLEEPYASRGLDRIVVLGLRNSSGAEESSKLIEGLINNHHYSTSGFSFIKQGTPTNNTEDDSSGYNSADFANETSYEVETGDILFSESNVDLEKSDAQRFAEALGITSEPLYHINNSNQTDVTEAKFMNTALWSGTLGYFMNEMMHPLFTEDQINFTRDYFTQYVTGRGPLPAIRVGNQPYGILPTSSFSNWIWTDNETGNNFTNYNNLHSVLSSIQNIWEELVSKVNYYGMSGDAYEILLNMIGLQGSSVEFYQRIGTDDTFTWNYLSMQNSRAAVQWVPIFKRLSDIILIHLGIDPESRPKIADVSFFDSQNQLTGPLIDENPLSETNTISAYDGINNYINWLLISDSDTINKEIFKDANDLTVSRPASLLYLMLRNSYLQGVWSNVNTLYQKYDLISAPVKEQSILNVKTEPEMTKMDFMMADVKNIFPHEVTSDVSMTAADFVQQPSILTMLGDSFDSDVKRALGELKDLPTARLERLFSEHLDLCCYRLDAWQTGIFTKRLEYLRSNNKNPGGESSKQKGIYIGAFGWLEDIRPDTVSLKKVDWDEIPEKLREESKGNVYEDPDNGGYIHGYSLNHALTGAVLRSAYISHADDTNTESMSVNLSSERIRKAVYYLDGIRNGQTLSSLLGYQFERGLHDNHSALNLDEYIYDFRDKYPLISSELSDTPSAGSPAASNVVDGYALLQASKTKSYPYDVSGLPPISSAESDAIIAEVNGLADVTDAIGDLALSESVYQIIQGNYERGGAILKSYSEGKNPPEPHIVNSPQKGETITNRIAINFENEPSDNLWGSTMSPRARTEKGLNKWLGSMIGDHDKIRCVVSCTYADATGSEIIIVSTVKLSEIDLQPIDFVLMTDKTFGNGSSELEKRIEYFFKRSNNISDSAIPEIQFNTRDTGWDESIKTFFEMIPMIRNLRQIITMCRSLNALDFMLPSEAQQTLNNNMKGYLADEIKNSFSSGRLDIIYSELETKKTDLITAISEVTEPFTSTAFDTVRDKLKQISDYGITGAFPVSVTGFTSAEYELLKNQTDSVVSIIEQRLEDSKNLLDQGIFGRKFGR